MPSNIIKPNSLSFFKPTTPSSILVFFATAVGSAVIEQKLNQYIATKEQDNEVKVPKAEETDKRPYKY